MSFQFCVLASGSGGNSSLLLLEGFRPDEAQSAVLIDAGLSPKKTATHLEQFDISLSQLRAIFLTHLDTDHFRTSWFKVCKKHEIPIYLHEEHAETWPSDCLPPSLCKTFSSKFSPGPETEVHTMMMPHDDEGSVAYRVTHKHITLGYLTDAGRVPHTLFPFFRGIDALAIESNYDPYMQRNARRPAFVKHRVMSGLGHISNEESWHTVDRIHEQSPLGHIVLLHLSRQCNEPHIIRKLYSQRSPELLPILTLAEQHQPTPLLRLSPMRSLSSVVQAPNETEEASAPQQLKLL